MKFTRQFPKACRSTNNNRIYVFGGCISNDQNALVEFYDCQEDIWSFVGINTDNQQLVLKEPFRSDKSFVIMVEGSMRALI